MRLLSIFFILAFTVSGDEVLQILSTGQSLSTGAYAAPTLSLAQPFNNVMLSPGVEGELGPFIPLVENGTGQNGAVETPSSGIANTVRAADPLKRAIMVGLHGSDGFRYAQLAKGTDRYQLGMRQAAVTKALVERSGRAYRPIAVTAYHGESDGCAQGPPITPQDVYRADLAQWQADYQRDLNVLIKSSVIIPLYINQMNVCATGNIPVAQLEAHRAAPGRVILVGPKYQYKYFVDETHLTNISTKYSAELMGKVIKMVFIDQKTWNPTMPTSVTRTGKLVTAAFNVPVAPLVIDTELVSAVPNYGFDFVQTGGKPVSITSVKILGDTAQITLSDIPTGTNERLRYAWGKKGNVRDSDAVISGSPSATGLPLYNWLVTFDELVKH